MRKIFLAACISFLPGIQFLNAQELISVTSNKLSYRPVVKNNRILWFETNAGLANGITAKYSVYVYEQGINKTISTDSSLFFSGWPDFG